VDRVATIPNRYDPEELLKDELEVNELSACVTAYWALRTAFCATCALVRPVVEVLPVPFSNELNDDPYGLPASVVPGRLNSEETSWVLELVEDPDTSELSV